MCQKFTANELNTMDHKAKNDVLNQMQDRLDKQERNYEKLIEQIKPANQQCFGRHTEKLDEISGQLSIFSEVEAYFDAQSPEPG